MSVFAPMIAEVGLVTLRGMLDGSNVENPIPHLPVPAVYTDVAIVYGALSLIGGKWERVAVAIGWGFVVVTALAMFGKAGTVGATNASASTNTQGATS